MGIPFLTAFVVLLTDIMQHGDMIPSETTLEVEKRLADQWVGVGIARAATEEEIAEYQGDAAEAEALLDDVDGLTAQKKALEDELGGLGAQHETLASAVAVLEGQKGTLTGEITALEGQKATLVGEVAELEARKAAAAKPATAAKPK